MRFHIFEYLIWNINKTIATECSIGRFPTALGNEGLMNLCIVLLDFEECSMGLETFRSRIQCFLDDPSVERDDNQIRINLKFNLATGNESIAKAFRVIAPPIFYFFGICYYTPLHKFILLFRIYSKPSAFTGKYYFSLSS